MATNKLKTESNEGWQGWLLKVAVVTCSAAVLFAMIYFSRGLAVPAERRSTPPNRRIERWCSSADKADMMRGGLSPDYGMGTTMHGYARHGLYKCLKDGVNQDADLDARDTYGDTVLHVIARAWHFAPQDAVTITKVLIRSGADVNARNFWGATPLHMAVENGNVEIARALLDAGAAPSLVDSIGRYPWEMAKADLPVWQELFAGTSWRSMLADEEALFTAVSKDDLVEVERLLSSEGVPVNVETSGDDTPLMAAATKGRIDILHLLVRHGADLNKQNAFGSTALYFAVRWGPDNTPDNTKAVAVLLSLGADTSLADSLGRSPLWWAACMGQTEVVKLLLDAGADVNARDIFGWTPLGWVQHYDPAMAELLKTHGAIALEPLPVGAQ